MELTVKDRIVLLGVLPKEGDFRTLKQIRVFREALAFTEDEIKMLAFINDKETGSITWSEPEDGEHYSKDFSMSDSILGVVRESLKSLNSKKKLNDDTFTIYEKFVPEED